MTIGEAINDATGWLESHDVGSARLDAELLLGHILKRERSWLLAHSDDELTSEKRQMYAIIVQRRTKRVPLVHLTGKREFYGHEFKITPDVLTPRVETEKMVEWAIKYAPKKSKLIDIGTGSGALAVTIAKHRPDLDVTATEVSIPALKIARQNATDYGVKPQFIESDLWANVQGTFETVVTNLPYLRDDARKELMAEVTYEPGVALFGGTDGLELYRKFFAATGDHIAPGGLVFTECDPWQHDELIRIAAKAGFKPFEEDYFILGFKRI